MADQGSITKWIDAARNGDAEAAEQIWGRYVQRLIALARQKLLNSPRRVLDEEDVVIDAFDSFFRAVKQSRFPKLNDRNDLWQVLVMLTARKAVNHIKHLGRLKRGGDVRGDSAFAPGEGTDAGIDQIVGTEPTPEFAAQVAEEVELLLERLHDDSLRTVALAKMKGYTNAEIAKQIGRKVQTVERKLRIIREIWSL